MTDSALLSLTPYSPQGISMEARFVERQLQLGQQRLQDSHCLGSGGKEVLEELYTVAEECRMPNWDGYGAEAVSQEAYSVAYRFLEELPAGFPAPSIGAEPDGCLTLEWHRTPRHTISVSASPRGELHYSALMGPNRVYGTEVFFDEPPKAILELILRILPP
jgi:hypothetical protein